MAPAGGAAPKALSDDDFKRLLAFRVELRSFLHWSEQAASEAGLTPALHQLLLAVRGHSGPEAPTIGEAAEALHMRHHSAVELAQRAESAGLLNRARDQHDQRRVKLALTPTGQAILTALTSEHLPRIAQLAAALRDLTTSDICL